MKQHKHAEIIKAWADGVQVQFRTGSDSPWLDVVGDPVWNGNCDYRVKPAEPERVYPETQMTATELCYEYDAGGYPGEKTHQELRRIVNRALRHAIDHGQVVAREEFDRAVGDRKARDKAIAKNVRHKCYMTAGSKICDLDLDALVAEVKP